jgi:hypothetical protein
MSRYAELMKEAQDMGLAPKKTETAKAPIPAPSGRTVAHLEALVIEVIQRIDVMAQEVHYLRTMVEAAHVPRPAAPETTEKQKVRDMWHPTLQEALSQQIMTQGPTLPDEGGHYSEAPAPAPGVVHPQMTAPAAIPQPSQTSPLDLLTSEILSSGPKLPG